ncbi:MAG: hypothetical protein BCS36_09425 [Desulfovibrio sp. MES5]|nr:MAG: hypothetical protein BCS36_09425 [Desulfovibrio sp. MES5]
MPLTTESRAHNTTQLFRNYHIISHVKLFWSVMTSQSKAHRWHCAARREIAERSEEAPVAEAAQPSRDYGMRKAQRGRPGGVQRGPRRGGSP